MYKEVSTASELKQEYYLSNAFGKVIALRSTVTETGQSPETKWEYYAHGAEREARLVKLHGSAKFGTDEVSFFLYDHLGNTRMSDTPKLRPGTTTVVQVSVNAVMDYYPYGKVLREYVNGEEERYLTTQHERDQETGLDYRGARYYDSDISRFLSLDPHASKYPSMSAYNYVAGNPLILIDPDGKDPYPTGNPLGWVAEGFRRFFTAVGDMFSFSGSAKVETTRDVKGPKGSSGQVYGGAKLGIQSSIGDFFRYKKTNVDDVIDMSLDMFAGSRLKLQKGSVSYETSNEVNLITGVETTENKISGTFMINGAPMNAEIFKITNSKGEEISGTEIGVGSKNKKLFISLTDNALEKVNKKSASVGAKVKFEMPKINGTGINFSGKVQFDLNVVDYE